jgi:hypothetical protein
LIVFVEALCPEIEKLRHLPTLMITPQHVDSLWVIQLQGKKKQDYFTRKRTSINIIPEEQILGF